jgi:hypothetical protein
LNPGEMVGTGAPKLRSKHNRYHPNGLGNSPEPEPDHGQQVRHGLDFLSCTAQRLEATRVDTCAGMVRRKDPIPSLLIKGGRHLGRPQGEEGARALQ